MDFEWVSGTERGKFYLNPQRSMTFSEFEYKTQHDFNKVDNSNVLR